MFFKRIFFPLFILELILLLVCSLFYYLIISSWNINPPEWLAWVIPVITSIAAVLLIRKPLFERFYSDISEINYAPLIVCLIILPVLTAILFPPLSKSIRYNFGSVIRLNSVNQVKPHKSSIFLELDDWYVDRLQVIPLRTISEPNIFSFGKYKVSILFIVPIFASADPYRSHAKAWLAFDYHKVFSREELNNHLDDEFANNTLIHFKRMDVRAFKYLEAFPRGQEYNVLIQMAQAHSYFKSGFSTVYKGQDVDRDLLAIHSLQYFLFLQVIFGIPLLLIAAGILTYFRPIQY